MQEWFELIEGVIDNVLSSPTAGSSAVNGAHAANRLWAQMCMLAEHRVNAERLRSAALATFKAAGIRITTSRAVGDAVSMPSSEAAEAEDVDHAGSRSEAAPMTIDDAIDFSNVPLAEEPSQPNAPVQGEQEDAGGDSDDEDDETYE